jgi:hypothetical protein
MGVNALLENTTGANNTANGVAALLNNTSGRFNTAVGVNALFSNTTASNNTANGFGALENNTIGGNNTATGVEALFQNTSDNNTANGFRALFSNTTGRGNTANGFQALQNNIQGARNTATGGHALLHNMSGNDNTAIGVNALLNNSSGSDNIALGEAAGSNITGSNNIDIGAFGGSGDSNTIRIGRPGIHNSTFIAGIFGVAMSGSVVVVNSSGKLGVTTSSARFKDNIKPMDKASEAILALKPVTFRYKKELDPDGIPQFGLVAEQVEKVNPDLVMRDAQGKVYTVRYEAVNAMLLNEFLKEHRKNEEQEATIARLQKQIEALSVGLQKVSAQLELGKTAPQTVVNRQ